MAEKPRKAKKKEILDDQISENYAHFSNILTNITTLTALVMCNLLISVITLGFVMGSLL